MNISRYIVTAVQYDQDGRCDGKARVVAICKTEDEAKNFVIEDMYEFIDDHANEDMLLDDVHLKVCNKDYSVGCDWNIEKVDIDV